MAADYFLQITGIAGESTDSKHKSWIDVEAWSWGETNPGTHATGGGGGAGKVQPQDLQIATRTSKASPKLLLACATGQHMKEAKLAGVHSGPTQQEYITVTITDVLISSYQTSGSAGDIAMDQVSLNFAKLRVEYKGQKADGSLDKAVVAEFDFMRNKKL